jgi:hypothetical protein
VNRIQQFRNIASRALGTVLDLPPAHGSTFEAAPGIAGVAIFRFPSEKDGFYHDKSVFPFTREQDNFHIFCHFYQHSPREGFPGRGSFGC